MHAVPFEMDETLKLLPPRTSHLAPRTCSQLMYRAGQKSRGALYTKAAAAITACPDAITSAKDAMKIKGIGSVSG